MENLPNDLIYEILMRSPAKAVERCIATSPACTNVVRKKSFHTDFSRWALNIGHRHALFVTRQDPIAQESTKWSFRSIIVEEEKTTLLCTTIVLPLHDHRINQFMNYACGLLCSGFGEHPIFFNPSNRRNRVAHIPAASDGKQQDTRSFVGFDSVRGFKVLAVNKKACHVLSLDTMTWKTLQVELLQPVTSSVYIHGVLYYAGLQTPRIMVLVSFNLATEVLEIHRIPQEPRLGMLHCEKVMSAHGKVVVAFAGGDGNHIIRILEDPATELWIETLIKP